MNLTYYCNNDCTFCFSHTTGKGFRQIDEGLFLQMVRDFCPSDIDVIVINGGEPSLHPGFERIVNSLLSATDSNVKVYTNGRRLSHFRIAPNARLLYIIPIHGERVLHDSVTRAAGSYDETISSVAKLELTGQRYALKFIVTPELVSSGFNIKRFLDDNRLSPYEVFIARLNETVKSRQNGCQMINRTTLARFVNESLCQCRDLTIKLLDIPPCAIPQISARENLMATPPMFYFCDDRNGVGIRVYEKQVKIFGSCDSCPWTKACETMSKTYLTLAWRNGRWSLEDE